MYICDNIVQGCQIGRVGQGEINSMLCKLVCASCTDSKVEELTRISLMSLYKRSASCLPSRCAGDYGQFASNVVKCHFCEYKKWKYTDPTKTLKMTWKEILNIVGPQYYPAGVEYSPLSKAVTGSQPAGSRLPRIILVDRDGIRNVGRVGSSMKELLPTVSTAKIDQQH